MHHMKEFSAQSSQIHNVKKVQLSIIAQNETQRGSRSPLEPLRRLTAGDM